jgi:hypothetical protein
VPRKDWRLIRGEEQITNPVEDIAVAYPMRAEYKVNLTDRE